MTKQQIHAKLIEQGLTFRQFALAHHYTPRTVLAAVERWAGKSTLPRGRLTFQILQDLSKQIGTDIIPGLNSATTNSSNEVTA